MDIVISIVSLLGFILLTAGTGLFVAIEFSLTSLERSTIETEVKERGDRSSRAVLRDYKNLSFVLSGAQLGITVTTLATGFLAEPILAQFFTPLLDKMGVPHSSSMTLAMVLSLVIATFLSMVFGELIPKNLAITNPMAVSRFVVHPVNIFNVTFTWFIKAMNASANFIVRKMGMDPADEIASARSAAELGSLVRHSAESGDLQPTTARVIEESLKFGETTAEEVMTPRSTINALDANDTVADLIRMAEETGHSRFPVIRGDLDDTVGVVHIKDAFSIPREKRSTATLGALARKVMIIPDSLDGDSVLQAVRTGGSQVVLVSDEYGGISGMITTEDMVEEIVGEVWDEHDDSEAERDFQKLGASWEINGLVRVDELEEKIGYRAPEGEYETVGGLVMATLGKIPEVADETLLPQSSTPGRDEFESGIVGRWVARVTVMDDRRVDRVILTPISHEEAEERQ